MGAINLFNFGVSPWDIFPFFAATYAVGAGIVLSVFSGFLIAFTPGKRNSAKTRMGS